jgi:hypothetical protein
VTRSDPDKALVYAVDSVFWPMDVAALRPFVESLTFSEFEQFCDLVYSDALAAPLPGQHRRRRKAGQPIVPVSEYPFMDRAAAYVNSQRIAVGEKYRFRWVALHEVAHLLTYRATIPHGSEFQRVYLGLIARWLSPEFRNQYYTFLTIFGESMSERSRSAA